jgi:uracil-DNA glycosylase family protein
LQNLNELAGLKKDEIYVTSLLKCKPAAKTPTNAYELCEPYFSAEARLVAPKLIVALGEEVFYKMIKQSAQSFETIRGNIMKFKHSALLATYSPAVIAKNPSKKELFFNDLKKIKEYL